MTCRPATEQDLAAILVFDHLAQADKDGRREFIAAAIQAGEAYVALVEDRIAGYAVLNYGFYGHGLIDMLYTNEQYRRQGVGRHLVQHLENCCTKEKLFTSTNQSNLAMQGLVNSLGYLVSGIIYNLDENDPELIYYKQLR